MNYHVVCSKCSRSYSLFFDECPYCHVNRLEEELGNYSQSNGTHCPVCLQRLNNQKLGRGKPRKYCSDECSRKVNSARSLLKHRRRQIALSAKKYDEDAIPYGKKMIWDGVGEWAKDYNCCLECGLTAFKHRNKGLCEKCYNSLRVRMNYEKWLQQTQKGKSRREKKYQSFEKEWVDRLTKGTLKKNDSTTQNLKSNLYTIKKRLIKLSNV